MRPRDRKRVSLLLAIALLGAVVSAPIAHATEASPLGVTSTLQTISQIEESFGPGNRLRRFVNKPYTFTQAGGHPYALTSIIQFTTEKIGERVVPTRDPKDIVVSLPPGLLGDPQAVPRCPLALLFPEASANRETEKATKRCPTDTQVGTVALKVYGGGLELRGPIVNVAPEAGQSAEFGLETSALNYLLTAHVVHGVSGYTLTVVSNEIPMVELGRAELTFWGVPADPSHDSQRGLLCELDGNLENCKNPYGDVPEGVPPQPVVSGAAPVPFLTMPTDCAAGPLRTVFAVDSWEEPGRYAQDESTLPGVTGCNQLRFAPEIEVQPDTPLADEPVGLGVNLRVPQVEQPEALATPQLRDAVVTLPEGLSISPGVVDGVQACNESGPEGINITGPESEEIGLNGEPQLAPGHCPNASTVGTAEAITPLLGEPVKGHVYLAQPGCGGAGQAPCTEQDALDGNLYKLYLELGGQGPLANAGVNLKVAGYVEANPATGQLTTKFLENPQLPFSELKIHLNGGPRAPLDTPAACGAAVTTADFTPWSAPGATPEGVFMPGTPDATPSSSFDVGGCASPPGLSPGFAAGTVAPRAGKFSAFTLSFSRQDREQFLAGIQVHTPPGLLGVLSSVPLCGEPQAARGTCPQASRIGNTTVASGAGSHPFEIGGSVYLTTGYKGAPFGLSIVTDAVAGPFNLGLVVVRARIDVNPETSALTVTSDPLPQIVFGVPLRLKTVTVDIDRPSFMFNPTNCAAQQVTAVVSGAENAVAHVSSPFAAAACNSLAFKPSFMVSTSAHASRLDGASLDAKVSFPPGPAGSEANIASVKVSLPKQLPARLTTLQKACTAATFEANPANCPAASVVGIARASTPLLPVRLEGPAYFVSHGGEAFPSLIVVLQGDGVRVDLTGDTFIKNGITSSTFKTVPDVPVNTFELYLPEGSYSALAANGNLCKAKLAMPTVLIAQNGAEINQDTKVAVTGCAKAKKRAKKPKRKPNAGHGRKSK